MGWWGTLAGGAFGFMIGGPIGAMVGAALGRTVDRGMSALDAESLASEGIDQQNRAQLAFFTATFGVMGHIAKADGRVTPEEIGLAARLMDHLGLDEQMRSLARELFRQGKSQGFDLDAVLTQFRRECRHSRNLRRMFVEVQIQAAYADDQIHPAERLMLEHICAHLGLSKHELDHLERLVKAGTQTSGEAFGGTAAPSLEEDYAVLELDSTASDADLKRAYRRMMSRHHPDKLIARGLPEEMVKVATEKTQAIKAAYDRIKASRS